VEIRGLTVTYAPEAGAPIVALDRVNLDVWPGDVVGIMGESGSGKSTLAASLLRLLPATASCAGTIRFENRDLLKMNERELRAVRGARLALIPQDPAVCLNPVIRVGEQIAEVIRAHMPISRAERTARVKELLREVCFDEPERIIAAYPHQLSGGERQRVVIAQAVACRPALVIADEPTAKLDPAIQNDILTLLLSLVGRSGAAMLLITHDPAILAGLATRIAVMYAGRVVEEGTKEDVLLKPLHPYTQGLVRLTENLRNPHLSHRTREMGHPRQVQNSGRSFFQTIAGEPPSLAHMKPGCQFEPRCEARLPVCGTRDPEASTQPDAHRVSCFLYGN